MDNAQIRPRYRVISQPTIRINLRFGETIGKDLLGNLFNRDVVGLAMTRLIEG